VFGSHLSISGSLVNALREAESLRMETVQIFTKNQQQWKAKPLDPGVVGEWRARVARLGWGPSGGSFGGGGPDEAGLTGAARRVRELGRTVSHASYLINLASPDDELWRKSIDLMTDEIERCETLGVAFLVHHPGAYTTSDAAAGVARIAAAYREVFGRTAGFRTVSCLEATVGAGSQLGGRFEQLAELRSRIADSTGAPERVGFCVDTCHIHSAGYDCSTRARGEAVLAEFDQICGLDNLYVVHVNDSKAPAGSRRDLHQHIGSGTLTPPEATTPDRAMALRDSGFAAFVNHPALRGVPKILETPKGAEGAGDPHDLLNLRRLWSLVEWRTPPELVWIPGDAPRTKPTAEGRVGARKARVAAKAAAGGRRSRSSGKQPAARVERRRAPAAPKQSSKTRGSRKTSGAREASRAAGRKKSKRS
jgi:deoxyribonuclease-4